MSFHSLLSILQHGMWLQSDIEQYLRRFRISHGQYSILLVLLEAGDAPVMMTDIAGKLGKSKPTITRMLEKLAARGTVAFRDHPTDARRKGILLTGQGRALLETIAPDYVERIDHFVADLSEIEKILLINTLNKLRLPGGRGHVTKKSVLPHHEKARLIRQLCESGSKYDIDCVLSFLDGDADIATTRFVDYYLGTVESAEGRSRIEHHLFHGTRIQRNYCTLYFLRRDEDAIVRRAHALGLIDDVQAFAR